MNTDLKESKIEAVLVAAVRAAGGRAYKFVSPGNSGVPDRIIVFPCRAAVFVELKTVHGTLSALQQVQQRTLKNLGQDVHTINSPRGVAAFMAAYGYNDIAETIERRYKDG